MSASGSAIGVGWREAWLSDMALKQFSGIAEYKPLHRYDSLVLSGHNGNRDEIAKFYECSVMVYESYDDTTPPIWPGTTPNQQTSCVCRINMTDPTSPIACNNMPESQRPNKTLTNCFYFWLTSLETWKQSFDRGQSASRVRWLNFRELLLLTKLYTFL